MWFTRPHHWILKFVLFYFLCDISLHSREGEITPVAIFLKNLLSSHICFFCISKFIADLFIKLCKHSFPVLPSSLTVDLATPSSPALFWPRPLFLATPPARELTLREGRQRNLADKARIPTLSPGTLSQRPLQGALARRSLTPCSVCS